MAFVKSNGMYCIIGHDNKGRPAVLCAEHLPEDICEKENENIDKFKELVVEEKIPDGLKYQGFSGIFRGSSGYFEIHYGIKGADGNLDETSTENDGRFFTFRGFWD